LIKKSTGLCNAVLLSEKNSEFVNLCWMNTNPSVQQGEINTGTNIPCGCRRNCSGSSEKITELSPYAFHYPLYDKAGLKLMFEDVTDFPGAYLHHLWNHFHGINIDRSLQLKK
jgi:hypothetical protein